MEQERHGNLLKQSAYWTSMARSERTFAQQERTSRYGTVESIRIHEQNATDYEARAAAALAEEDHRGGAR